MNRIEVDTLVVCTINVSMTLVVNITHLIIHGPDCYQNLGELTQTKRYFHFFLIHAGGGNYFETKIVIEMVSASFSI